MSREETVAGEVAERLKAEIGNYPPGVLRRLGTYTLTALAMAVVGYGTYLGVQIPVKMMKNSLKKM